MGAAASIATTEYDAEKFQKSKQVMESKCTDEEKFESLREIWNPTPVEAAAVVAPADGTLPIVSSPAVEGTLPIAQSPAADTPEVAAGEADATTETPTAKEVVADTAASTQVTA